MFDPSDFSYKELSDTLRDHYDPDDILLTNIIEASDPPSNSKSLAEVTEQMISSVENQLSIHSNESGRFFNIDSTFLDSATTNNIENNEGIFIVQPPDNLFNYEPTLLDDNTVNQFLLPLQSSSENNKDLCIGPDLLALHSCVICHEIFTMEADLLDHTISHHASTSIQQRENAVTPLNYNNDTALKERSSNFENLDFEGEWLICSICKRVLATALEVEPSEQLCCIDGSGKSSVSTRKLHTMFVCEGCSGLFADGEALDRHRIICFIQDSKNYEYSEEMAQDESNSNAKVYQESAVCFSCDTCGKQYGTADQLKAHAMDCQRPVQRKNERRPYNSSNSNKMWNCGSCNQLFATARELYRHKRGEDRPTGAPLMAYVCEECDKVLGSMCALHTHKKMHKNSKPGYPCRVCGRRFNQSGHLAIHMRMHTGERPYPCDLCPKAFKVKVERDDHRRTHTGERPFACAACPKTFTAAARLREHARIHTDQRPYRCDICGAAFRRPYARTVHTLIHTGEKPHECDVCGTAFRRSGDMWKHKRTLHGIQAGSLDS